MPPKKIQCYTKPRKDGSKYTTCLPGQKKKKDIKRKAPAEKAKPKSPPKTAGEKATGLTREQMNKLDPLALFALLPKTATARVRRDVGEDFINSYDELRGLKGLKKRDFAKDLGKIQANIFEKSKSGKRARYAFGGQEEGARELVKLLKKDKDLKPLQFSQMMEALAKRTKQEVDKLKKSQPKPKARRTDTITAENLYDAYAGDYDRIGDYESGVAEGLSYDNYPGSRMNDSESKQMKFLERVSVVVRKRGLRLIKDYLKKNKPKTMAEAEAGVKKFADDNDLDDYILKSDF
jgi:hypothetical protein